jgi:hypothetical protein
MAENGTLFSVVCIAHIKKGTLSSDRYLAEKEQPLSLTTFHVAVKRSCFQISEGHIP